MGATAANALRQLAPCGLVVSRFDVGGDAFVLFEWSVSPRELGAVLTPALSQVLELLLEGCSNAEIARSRCCAPRTIANQVASIFRQLRVHSRLELIAALAPPLLPWRTPQ
jgi:DNA-binding NarL/FixJ family response regulator